MFLIVGLGNPGAEYAKTRHNVGFWAADTLHQAFGFGPWRDKFDAEVAEGSIGGQKCLLVKPQTFMNASGNAVVKAAHFYKILPADIVVIHDDIDLPAGKVKAKLGGGSGGHNGIKSVDAAVTPDYNRIRIGVGHPQGSGEMVINHVLSRFSKADEDAVAEGIEIVATAIETLLKDGMVVFCNKIGDLQHKKQENRTNGV